MQGEDKVDVYDCSPEKSVEINKIGIKQTADMKVGTDQNKNLLSSRDWFYSDIHRRLLIQFYETQGLQLSQEAQDDFAAYDWGRGFVLRDIK